jgi:hypothetical protein
MKNKTIPFLLVSAIITACSPNISPVINSGKISTYSSDLSDKKNTFLSEQEIAGFDKEYVFSTKLLTETYLKRKIDKWLDVGGNPPVPDGPKLVKEITYARYKFAELFRAIMENNEGMLDDINGVQEVIDRRIMDIPFAAFLDSFIPTPEQFIGEFKVNSYTNSQQEYPSVGMDGDGDFVIAWECYGEDGSGAGIYAQRYKRNGSPNGSEFRVNSYTTNNQNISSVTMDNAGDFVVTWQSNQDGSGAGIYAQRYKSDGSLNGSEFRVNSYTANTQNASAVSMDGDGDFVVTWSSGSYNGNTQDGSGFGIYAQRYNSAGAVQGSEFRVNSYTTSTQNYPAVAMSDDGDFVVAWQSFGQDGFASGIYAQRYKSDASLNGSEFRVNSYTDNQQTNPLVALDSDGDFVITWQSYGQDGSAYGLYAQRYKSDGSLNGSEFKVNSYTDSYQTNSSLAMDNAGDFVATWNSEAQDNSGNGVFARRYKSDGSADGSEFQVNSYTTFTQFSSSVAMDNAGDFVVAWHSYQDGSAYGIYAQRYNSAGIAK